jgi:hypothetical protein
MSPASDALSAWKLQRHQARASHLELVPRCGGCHGLSCAEERLWRSFAWLSCDTRIWRLSVRALQARVLEPSCLGRGGLRTTLPSSLVDCRPLFHWEIWWSHLAGSPESTRIRQPSTGASRCPWSSESSCTWFSSGRERHSNTKMAWRKCSSFHQSCHLMVPMVAHVSTRDLTRIRQPSSQVPPDVHGHQSQVALGF